MSLTLEELKRKNAEGESEESQEHDIDEQQEELDESLNDESETEDENDASDDHEEDPDGDEDESQEAWMTTDDENDDDRSVPLNKHISLRTKLKSKVKERDEEIETLRAKIEKLEKPQQQQEGATLQPPKAQSFQDEYGETDWDKFNEANAAYMQDLVESRLTGNSKKSEETAKKRKLEEQREQSINHHYELADKLVQKGIVTAEDYASADSVIVNTLEESVPGHGRSVADGLIQHLSEVTDQPEKVWFKLGKDKALLNQVINAYQEDPSGVKGVAELARPSQKYVTGIKRKSTAPKPASKVEGDASTVSDAAKLQKQYNSAHKKRNTAEAFRIKRQAKKNGVDTSKW